MDDVERCVLEEYEMSSWIRSWFFEDGYYANHAPCGSLLSSWTCILHRFRRMRQVYFWFASHHGERMEVSLPVEYRSSHLLAGALLCAFEFICIMIIKALICSLSGWTPQALLFKGSWWGNLWRAMFRQYYEIWTSWQNGFSFKL